MPTSAFKIILHVLGIAVTVSCQPTKSRPEPLKAYTYPVFATGDSSVNSGNGFFYKYKGRIFFVTTYHIRGMNPFNETIQEKTNYLHILYPRKKVDSFGIIKIQPEDVIQLFSYKQRVDLYKIEIANPPNDGKINFINDFVDQDFNDQEPDSILSFSYRVDTLEMWTSPKFIIDSCTGDFMGKFNPIDSLVQQAKRGEVLADSTIATFFSSNYFLSSAKVWPGNSGTPLFGCFHNDSVTKYVFTGMYIGKNYGSNKAWCIRSRAIIDFIEDNP